MSHVQDTKTCAYIGVDKNQTLISLLNSEDWAAAEDLIIRGSSVHQTDSLGRTPLHIAASHGLLDLANTLIAHGADLNAEENEHGQSPIFEALLNRHSKTAELLIKSGANVTIQNCYKESPIHIAVKNGDLNVVDCIIEYGTDLGAFQGCYLRSLCETFPGKFSKVINILNPLGIHPFVNNEEIVQSFIRLGVDINLKDKFGDSFLAKVILCGCVDLAKWLINAGADFVKDHTAFHKAVSRDMLDIVEIIIERGADVHLCNEKLETPLHIAAVFGSSKSMKLLLEKGHEVDCIDFNGATPLKRAVCCQSFECVPILLDWSARTDSSVFSYVLDESDYYFAKSLIKQHRKRVSCLIKFRAGNSGRVRCTQYQMTCFKELIAMKAIKFGALSVFVVFLQTWDPKFVTNVYLEKWIFGAAEQSFPMYSNILGSYFVKAKERNDMLNKVEEYYNTTKLHCVLKRKIITYLSDADLRYILKNV